MQKVRIWDLPTRVFHGALIVAVIGALVSQALGEAAMVWHFYFGYTALSLVLFRIIWGVVGSRYARFASFVRGPGAVLRYLCGASKASTSGADGLGHNPLGGWSVMAMLLVVLIQASSGLFANDDIATEGPLAQFIAKDLSDQISWVHAQVTGNLIYALIALHVLAIAHHRWRHRVDLITPMITGDKTANDAALAVNDSGRLRALAMVVMSLCAMAVYGLVQWR